MYFNDSDYNWTNVNESGGGVPQNQRLGEGVYVNPHSRAVPDPLSSPPNNHSGRIPMDNYSRSPQLHPHMNPTRQPASQSHDNMSANAGYYGYSGNTPQSFQHSNMGSYPAKSYGNRMQIPQMQQNMPLKQDIDAVLPVVGNSTQSYMGNMAYSQPRYKTSVTPDVQHRQYYIQSAPNDVNCAPNSNYYLRSPQCGSAATRMQSYSQPIHQQQQNTSYINNGSGMPGAQPRQLQQGMPSQPGQQVPYYYNKQNMHNFPNQISPEAQGIHQDRLQASRIHSGRNLSMEMASPRHLTPQRQHFPQSTPMVMSGHSQVSNIPSGMGVMSSGPMPGVPAPQFHSERPRPHFINQSPMPSPNSTRHLQVSPQHVSYGYRQQSPSRHDILAVPGQPHYPHNPQSMSAVSSYCASTMTTTITTIAKSPTSYSMSNSNSTGVLPPDNPMYGNKMPQISPQRMPVSNCNNASIVKPTLENQPALNQCNNSQILNPSPILPPGQQVKNNSNVPANPEPTVASIQQGKISGLPSEFNLDSLLDERMDTGGSFMQQLESCSPVVSCNKKKDFEYSENNATVSTAALQKKPESNLSIPQNNQSASFAQAPSQDTQVTGNKFNTIQTNVPAKLSPNTMASQLMSSTSYCVTTAQMPVSTPSASITTLQHQDVQPLTSLVGTVGGGATVCSATVSSSNVNPAVAVNQRFQHRMPGPMAIQTSYRSPRPPFSMQDHITQQGLPSRFPHPAQQYGDPRFPVPAGPSQIMPPCHYGPRNDPRMQMHPGQPYSVYNHHPMQADYARPPGMFPEDRPNHFLPENMQSGPMHRFPGPMGQVMPGPAVDKKTSMLMSSDDTTGEKKKTTKKSKAARALKKNEGDDKDKSPRKKKKRIVKVDDLNSKTDSDNSRSSNPVPSEDLESNVPNLHQDNPEMANGSQELSEEMARVKARITEKKKKKPPATVMKMKKKRKKGEESDDFDDTGPAAQSPDDSVEKRRSSRNVKRKRYMETVDIQLSEDDSESEGAEKNALKQQHTSLQNEEDNVDEQLVVEKILVMRVRKVPLQQSELKDEVPSKDPTDEGGPQVEGLGQDLPDEAQDDVENFEKQNMEAKLPAKPDDDAPAEEDDGKKHPIKRENEEVEEFYVKYKNYSYLHCEWKSKDEFQDKRVDSKIKRYKSKLSTMNEYYTDLDVSEPFNPDFVVVERVLDVSNHEDSSGNDVKHYLVKWCSLPYEDSTWETEADVPQQKISEFTARCQYRPVPTIGCQPSKNSWRKLTETDGTFKNGNMLRDYQLEGISWLLFNWYNRRNCILADEMGLGKTIQSITFLQKIFDRGIPGPFLVVAPLSTIGNWQREFSQWTDINAVVYHGSQVSREMIQTYEFLCRDENLDEIPGTYKMHAVITTYEMIVLENSHLEHIDWQVLIIDEAHRLKNQSCKLADCLRAMHLRFKVLLTGTPLQNNVEELFALLNFLQPEVFNSSQAFLNEFGNLTDNSQVQKLQELLKPMMLRRLKEDVEKSLAPKEETIIEVELTDVQKKYYRAILERNFEYLSKGSSSGNVPNLMNTMMELRKCCNHPYLIKGAEEKIFQEYSDKDKTPIELMIQSSGKLVLIDKLLPKLKSNGHKVLIFSQMVRCLDILEDYMVQHKYLYERIDGCVRGNDRQAAIDRFSKPESDRFVFLLCTRAGGLGINLTAADTVIIFDSDWNPQNDLQAQARCHRIGQLKSVKIYRLITRNSYEREMFDKASLKLGLDKAVLQSISGRQDQLNQVQGPALSKQEVEDLLKRGAYGAIMDEDDDAKKFCEEDIDQILQRRAHTITIESGVKGSTFSKASFVSGEDSTDISLDDPNFWEKWAKKADLDISRLKTNKLIIEEPRRRKQTKRFGGMTGDDEVLAELGSESDSDYEEWSSSKKQKGKSKTRVWSRRECFRVEKNLLTFGWGRWQHILKRGGFPAFITNIEIEQVTRALLIYCLKFYNGDEKIKVFMWELITPLEHSANASVLQNHEGLSAPVPRGRKGRRAREEADALRKQQEQVEREWVQEINVDSILQDDGFKKHLQHHCNKILLRVRMLYYLQSEIVGPIMSEIEETHYEKLELDFPDVIPDPPASWWDSDCDKCLLIGVCKHGYEKYNMIRADPKLCFLKKVGMPDNSALAADLDVEAYEDNDDPEYKPAKIVFSEYSEFEDSPSSTTPGTAPASPISVNEPNGKSSTVSDTDPAGKSKDEEKEEQSTIETSQETKEDPKTESSTCEWPSISEMNLRIRRMIASYQKHYKQIHARLMNLDRSNPNRFNDMSAKVKREQLRWTRREEADFYRTVSTFGVEYDKDANLCWKRFRRIAKLDRKSDDSLKLYYLSFRAMCERVCGKEAKSNDADPNFITVDQITEERASRTLYRIQLLNRIRLDVLRHDKLEERMGKCERSPDLPVWWKPGQHDKELILGMDKHGVTRTEIHILNDPTLSFLKSMREYESKEQAQKRKRKRKIDHCEKDIAQSLAKTEEKIEIKEEKSEIKEEKSDVKVTVKEDKIEEKDLKETEQVKMEDVKTEETDKSEIEESSVATDSTEDKKEEASKEEVQKNEDKGKEEDKKINTVENLLRRESLQEVIPHDSDSLLLFHTSYLYKWPKDRVLIQRVEHICYCIVHGEWPVQRLHEGALSFFNANPMATSMRPYSPASLKGFDTASEALLAAGKKDKLDSEKGKASTKQSYGSQRRKHGHDSRSSSPVISSLKNQDTTPLSNLSKYASSSKSGKSNLLGMPDDKISGNSSMSLLARLEELSAQEKRMENDKAAAWQAAKQSNALLDLCMSNKQFSDTLQKLLKTDLCNMGLPLPNILSKNPQYSSKSSESSASAEKSSTKSPKYSAASTSGSGKSEKTSFKEASTPQKAPHTEPDAMFSRKQDTDNRSSKSKKLKKSRIGFISPAVLPSDTRIPVHNPSEGKKIGGEQAPMNRDLADWLTQHPGFVVDYKTLRQKLDRETSISGEAEKETPTKLQPSSSSSSKRISTPVNSTPEMPKMSKESRTDKQNATAILNDKNAYPPIDPAIAQLLLNMPMGLMDNYYGISPEAAALLATGAFPTDLALPSINQDYENRSHSSSSNKYDQKRKKTSSSSGRHSDKSSAHDGSSKSHHSKDSSDYNRKKYESAGSSSSTMPSSASLQEEADAAMLTAALAGYLPNTGGMMGDPYQLMNMFQQPQLDPKLLSLYNLQMFPFFAGMQGVVNPLQGYPNLDMSLRNSFPSFSSNSKSSSSGNKSIESTSSSSSRNKKTKDSSNSSSQAIKQSLKNELPTHEALLSMSDALTSFHMNASNSAQLLNKFGLPNPATQFMMQAQLQELQKQLTLTGDTSDLADAGYAFESSAQKAHQSHGRPSSKSSKSKDEPMDLTSIGKK